ncbi:MAG TPA: MBL fold metallo-hydrolase [Solirubrobacteraceae bacterium]|nr:MBL fold metallo-hydrolase [Solirubrobacteraceae bacterium]
MAEDALARHDVALLRAANPGPFTLHGTNTWIVGRDPCWIVDPGPDLDEHVEAVLAEAARRGGAGGIVLTHDHPDHAGAAAAVRAQTGADVHAARWEGADVILGDGDAVGPFAVVATPGHATDHLAFVAGEVCFTGDAVLAHSSVFVAPDPGALRGYLAALERLRALDLALLCTGHGPPVTDPAALLDRYIAHRLDRERRLVLALDEGLRSMDELLDRVWDDAPSSLRLAAAATLMAHLGKLDEEGRLPDGVERPAWPPPGGVRPVV